MPMRRIVLSRTAQKTLRRMPANTARTVLSKIKQYAEDPKSLANNVTKLQGRPGYRLRIGDWRVIFEANNSVVAVLDVGPRGGIYE